MNTACEIVLSSLEKQAFLSIDNPVVKNIANRNSGPKSPKVSKAPKIPKAVKAPSVKAAPVKNAAEASNKAASSLGKSLKRGATGAALVGGTLLLSDAVKKSQEKKRMKMMAPMAPMYSNASDALDSLCMEKQAGVYTGALFGIPDRNSGLKIPKKKIHKKLRNLDANYHDLDKWNADKNHNTLYISGISGSGKTTLSSIISDKKTDVIHLDDYFDPITRHDESALNLFLRKNKFNNSNLSNKLLFNDNKDEYFKNVDRFCDLVDSFSKNNFEKGRKVIVEGTKIMDDTMYPDKTFFNGMPYIELTTDPAISRERAENRDKEL